MRVPRPTLVSEGKPRRRLLEGVKDTTFESTKKWRIESALLESTMSRPEGGTHVVVGPSAAPEARLPSSP